MRSPSVSSCPVLSVVILRPIASIVPIISCPNTCGIPLSILGPCPRQKCKSEPQIFAMRIRTSMSSGVTDGIGYSRNSIGVCGCVKMATFPVFIFFKFSLRFGEMGLGFDVHFRRAVPNVVWNFSTVPLMTSFFFKN